MGNPQLRPLPFTDRYLISDLGEVISKKTKEPKTKHIRNGYYSLNLFLPEIRENKNPWVRRAVHILVVETFIRVREKGEVINHLDGNKLNNKLENLEITTYSGNVRHALATGLSSCKGDTHFNGILKETQVREICELILNTNLFYREIAEIYGVSQSTINNIAQKHRWVEVSDQYWKGKVQRLGNRNRDTRRRV